MNMYYCQSLSCLCSLAGLRGTEEQFPKHTTIEQQFPFSMCNQILRVCECIYRKHLHRHIPKTSGKPCLHFKIRLQTMETREFLSDKSFPSLLSVTWKKLEDSSLKASLSLKIWVWKDVMSKVWVWSKKLHPGASPLAFTHLKRQGRRLGIKMPEFLILITLSGWVQHFCQL